MQHSHQQLDETRRLVTATLELLAAAVVIGVPAALAPLLSTTALAIVGAGMAAMFLAVAQFSRPGQLSRELMAPILLSALVLLAFLMWRL